MRTQDLARQFLMDLQDRAGQSSVHRPFLASHQRDAADRLLSMLEIYPGALLADAAGLGKSWIAGAVAERYEREGSAVELVVPHSLMEQWSLLIDEFSLNASLESHEGLLGKPYVPLVEGKRLLIVDEAHRFRNRKRKRYRSLAGRAVGARVLLITATPICNSVGDLHSLLMLFASDDLLVSFGVNSIDESFSTGNREAVARIRDELIVRRGREVLPPSLQLARTERSVIEFSVSDVDGRLARAVADLQVPALDDPATAALVRAFLWRRLESSEAAFSESVRRQQRFYRQARESLLKGVQLTKRDYRLMFGTDQDDLQFQDVLFRDLWSAPSKDHSNMLDRIDRELQTLGVLSSLAPNSDLRKRELLIEKVAELQDPQVLIFTGAVATARSLHLLLSPLTRCGIVTSRFSAAAGLQRPPTPDEVFRAFRSGGVTCLIATDMAAEGLNLQQAGTIVHYDLAWNMVRLEQREARANRIGQTRTSVSSIYFISVHGERTGAVRPIILRKARMARQYLSESTCEVPNREIVDHDAIARSRYLSVDNASAYCALLLREVFRNGERGRLREVTTKGELSLETSAGVGARHLSRARNPEWHDELPPRLIDCVRRAEQAAHIRASLPPRQLRTTSRDALAELARSLGRSDSRFETLLSGRYRAGLEMLIEEMSQEFFDESRKDYLSGLLVRDREEMAKASTVRIEVVGGVFTKDWHSDVSE